MSATSRLAVAIPLLLSAPAHAGNLAPVAVESDVAVAAAPAPLSFAGAYVGGSLGASRFDFDGARDAIFGPGADIDTDDDGSDDFEFDDTAVTGGLHAGFNVQRGRFVFGPELALSGSGADVGGESNFDDGLDEDSIDVDVNYKATIAMRAGVARGANLFYGSLGASYLELNVETGGVFFDAIDEDFSDWGLALGVGFERLVDERFVVGIQYTYESWDDFDFDDNTSSDFPIDIVAHTVSLRASYRF